MEHVSFAKALLRSPRHVGSIAPSSRRLGERLATVVPEREGAVIVELGAGTGAVTTSIEQHRAPSSTFVAFERDAKLATRLTSRSPSVHVVAEDARNVRTVLAGFGFEHADAVVSGLPWANFSSADQDVLLTAIAASLTPEGAFTTFAYLHALRLGPARRFRARLGTHFDNVVTTPTIWWNLPPAITYVCRQPRPDADGSTPAHEGAGPPAVA